MFYKLKLHSFNIFMQLNLQRMRVYYVIHDGFGLVLRGQESYLLYQFSEDFPAISIIYLFWIGNSNIKL